MPQGVKLKEPTRAQFGLYRKIGESVSHIADGRSVRELQDKALRESTRGGRLDTATTTFIVDNKLEPKPFDDRKFNWLFAAYAGNEVKFKEL